MKDDKDRISHRMSLVRSKNTSIEQAVKKELRKLKIKIGKHKLALPGKPDIIISELKTAIFVHGCFWHGCKCKKGQTRPKTNIEFWNNKISRTKERDRENRRDIKKLGWKSITIWECQIKANKTSRILSKYLAS